jgi:hypothetical protein
LNCHSIQPGGTGFINIPKVKLQTPTWGSSWSDVRNLHALPADFRTDFAPGSRSPEAENLQSSIPDPSTFEAQIA